LTGRPARALGMAVVIGLLFGASPCPAFADSIRARAWHLAALRIAEAHRVSQGEGVIVAVVDTGVDDGHAELAGAVLSGKGYGEGNDNDGRADIVGHGTAMAGVIAGRGLPDNGGVLGVAPRAMILPLLITNQRSGFGVPQFLADAIDWAAGHGAKVICIASSTEADDLVRQAVARALAIDVVVVAAAGNTPDHPAVTFPASLPGVVAVGGTDRGGMHAQISASGPEMVVAAPAVEIPSTALKGKYELGTGTSDATAIVAGVVALVRAKYPALPAAEVVRRIALTATDKGKPGRDDEYGFGIVDPVAALTAEVPSPAPSGSPVAAPRRDGGDTKVMWAVGVVAVLVLVWWLVRRRFR
jgi:type VII secretion-associated serine protease mycosin